MKTTFFILVLTWFGVAALTAQVGDPKPGATDATDGTLGYEEIARDAHSRVWSRVSYETNALGEAVATTNSFVELQTGLHYRERDQWLASEAKIAILPNNAGAAAAKGQHKVLFPPEIKSGIIELQTPDQQWLRSRVWGLSYFDSATGDSVLIAEVKESEGQLLGDNTVIYPDAFTDVLADVKYDYLLSGFEQDVVIRSQLPGPEKFGMNPKSVRLQVLTEFVETPTPTKENRQAGGLADQALRFGQMSIGGGRAFSVDAVGDATGEVPVAKAWLPLDGRDFLVEEVYYEKVSEQLQKLPTVGEYQGASLQRRGTGTNVIAGLKNNLPKRYARTAPKPGAKRMAQVTPKAASGFVMDYVLLTSQANFTFQGDSTYYVSGLVNLSASGVGGATTIEAGTIVKFTNSATAKINLTGPGNFQTSQYRPAVFTSKDDNTVGETIPGSTGNPTNYNGGTYLSTQEHYTYKHLRMAYAGIAIRPDDNDSDIWHCQFVRCGTAISVSTGGNVSLHNTLFSGCGTAIASGDGARGEHVTADQIGTFLAYGAGYLTNSLLTAVTNLGVTRYNCVTNASGNGIYQSVGRRVITWSPAAPTATRAQPISTPRWQTTCEAGPPIRRSQSPPTSPPPRCWHCRRKGTRTRRI